MNDSGGSAIALRGATVRFGHHVIWEKLDLDVAPGTCLAILGSNGSGKTTLMKVLLGLLPLSAGTITINGRPPGHGSAETGYVAQQRVFDPDLPIRGRDLVQFGVDGQRWACRGPGAARWTPYPSGRRARLCGCADRALSGGQQQRLRIAQALACGPRLLLCDEPLARSTRPRRKRSSRSSTGTAASTAPPWCTSPTRSLPSRMSSTRSSTWRRAAGQPGPRHRAHHAEPQRPLRHPHRRDPGARPRRHRRRGRTPALMGIGFLLQQPFAQHALLAAALVAVSCGLIGPFVVTRGMAFAVHGTTELAFTGAAAGLLVANNPVVGALVGAVVVAGLIALFGAGQRERDSAIGVILAFGMGIGVLLLRLLPRLRHARQRTSSSVTFSGSPATSSSCCSSSA